ncbi:O-acetylhomoserine (thiol)-lyase [Clostridium algifaecis]|uniref:O-acetylhomoserine (Thiol)-lyase n=1 Tax=Clostridium algifaecis TaxID=1472040 RepID=A0ABS4KVP2_9CLOT|nr:O-acetylhomoserine aminocarboxypropyltransferase/cysteine synthase family protein [Clostridium algifaecis]MBP2032949.1 O-acetylhomoserine (thiol)-lyase [Clostridium algifaecis]
MNKKFGIGTRSVQSGYYPESGDPRVVPIVQSTSYKYDTFEEVGDVAAAKTPGYLYTRIGNPTVAALEKKYVELEGGVEAIATASGQSAVVYSIINIANSGDSIIASSKLYGGTYNLFNTILPKLGIKVYFVDPGASKEEILSAAKENTKLIYGETIGNPGLDVLDFDKFSYIAKKLNIPFIVDNTIATPYLTNPFEYGVNIVVHSTTKYSDGHAVSLGGIIIDGGNFNWSNGKFPDYTTPTGPTGLIFVDEFKEKAFSGKLRVNLVEEFGAAPAPFNAFLTNLGLETLHLRMERHCSNALSLAKYLSKHPKVEWVRYPYLELDKEYDRAKKYLKGGASGILTFGVKGGIEAAKKVGKSLKVASIVVNLGDVRTYVIHPASTTHIALTEEQQRAAGVTPELIRVSVGIEDIEDIIADFEQALDKI